MTAKELGMRSLRGVWVGDCIGNMGQLYNVFDILKALEAGMAKYQGLLPTKQFQSSDDTEEAIVLYNHVVPRLELLSVIDVDSLALEFATRFVDRDPDGEHMGYGLMTRKVLRDIYDGVPWNVANKTYRKSEGTSSHVDDLVNALVDKKKWDEVAQIVQDKIHKEKAEPKNEEKVGSCGNGAAMRIAPLGALLFDRTPEQVGEAAAYSALPTHDHPEGVAGAMAIAGLAWKITQEGQCYPPDLWKHILQVTPAGEVYSGLLKASLLDIDTPLGHAIQILGNGSHVTCQDTVPLCCWLTIRGIQKYKIEDMYEKTITDTSACQGDVDTNCAIVGGMIGIISPPPEKWVQFCQPMEGILE